jgi:hypothetical protein
MLGGSSDGSKFPEFGELPVSVRNSDPLAGTVGLETFQMS